MLKTDAEKPRRIQRRRTAGWRMPPNTVYVGRTRGGFAFAKAYANPFRVGGWFKIGDPRRAGFAWLEAHPDYADGTFTKIESREQAVAFFKLYRERYPFTEAELAEIRGKDLACWCPLDQPCHADVLLRLANDAVTTC